MSTGSLVPWMWHCGLPFVHVCVQGSVAGHVQLSERQTSVVPDPDPDPDPDPLPLPDPDPDPLPLPLPGSPLLVAHANASMAISATRHVFIGSPPLPVIRRRVDDTDITVATGQ